MTREDSKEGAAASAVVDDREFASSSGSFKLEGTQDKPGTVLKRFSLPDRVPFAVSAEPFAIVGPGQEAQSERQGGAVSERESGKEVKRQKRWEADAGETERNLPARRQRSGVSKPAGGSLRRGVKPAPGSEKTASGPLPNGTYYIYSFDGRMLAEYNVAGQWVRDYIYFGGRLVAEYRAATPQPQYYFYASDQISSTRIVTDSTGAVVYAAAHEPYGGIQKTWVGDYDPELKFSGKPRDSESELDYFGARYYDRAQYRFISADSVRNSIVCLQNPQRMNLFSYCMNNPISFMDLDGRDVIPVILNGIGGKLHTYVDSVFAGMLSNWINCCRSVGIEIEFREAYRTQAQQDDLRRQGKTDTKYSLHSAGWAVDINTQNLDSLQLLLVNLFATISGMRSGSYFSDRYEPWHFDSVPEGDRIELIQNAAMTIAAFDFWGIVGLTSQELYMLYGVFTERAAWLVVINAELDLSI